MADGVLDTLRERLDCTIRLRGNQLTLEGDDRHVEEAREVIDELVELVEGGHQIGSHTVDAVLGALEADQDRSEEHTSELQSRFDLVCRLLLEKKKKKKTKV